MANPDKPNGFKFAQTQNGSAAVGMARKFDVAARADSTNNHGDIYIGDPVKISTAGVVTVADSGATIYGVVMGVGVDNIDHGPTGMYKADDLETRYLANLVAGVVWIIPKENAVFEIQSASDLDLTVNAPADITNTAGTAHGSQTTSQSSCELAATSNADVTVVAIVDSPNNDGTLANARYLVTIN